MNKIHSCLHKLGARCSGLAFDCDSLIYSHDKNDRSESTHTEKPEGHPRSDHVMWCNRLNDDFSQRDLKSSVMRNLKKRLQ